MREHDEEDLPILDAVVRGGDAAIIQSSRLGRETLAELEALRLAALAPAPHGAAGPDGDAPARPGRGDGSPVFLDPDTMRPRATPPPAAGSIDVVLEREVDALRRELRALLGAAAAERAGER